MNSEQKRQLAAVARELEKQRKREAGKAYGRKLDQIEACYRQYQPPQCR